MLIAEAKNTIRINTIRINISVSNVYTFLHADFEGVEFYTTRRYVYLKKEVREEYLFVSYEDE